MKLPQQISRFICLTILLLPPVYNRAFSFSSSDKTGGDIHAEITREALHDSISDANLNFLIKAGESQDLPNSEGSHEARRHFDNNNFNAALSYLDREKKMALNYAADADQDAQNRSQCLRHLGLMLHTVQDFYSRSNYIELLLEDTSKRRDPLNLELVDWTRIPSGYIGKTSGNGLTSGFQPDGKSPPETPGTTAYSYQDLNKDSSGSTQGKKSLSGYSYFQIARELAIKETQRQWNLFATLVQGRYRDRAPAILSALKSAPVNQLQPAEPDADLQ